PRVHPGRPRPVSGGALVHRTKLRERLVAIQQVNPAVTRRLASNEAGPRPVEVDRALERGQPVAVSAVDPALRGVEGGHRLAGLMEVVELATHERGVHA